MASYVIYPPSVENYAAAFVATSKNAACRVFFSLSRVSTVSEKDIKGIHISIVKQSSGLNVVNKTDEIASDESASRYRSSGIIIINIEKTGLNKVPNESNLYYIDIYNRDIENGWTIGWIYKLQIRLSTIAYSLKTKDGEINIGQTAWLVANGNNFSEWSTYCTTKAIGMPRIQIPMMQDFDSELDGPETNEEEERTLNLSTMEFIGSYSNIDTSELLYSYTLDLYDTINNKLIETSGVLYTNQYYNPNQIAYRFKHEFNDGERAMIRLSYTTINRYESFIDFYFVVEQIVLAGTTIEAITVDFLNNIDDKKFVDDFKKITTIQQDNEEGRVSIKIYSNNPDPFLGNLCLRRTDSKSNFTIWEDIKIFPVKYIPINSLEPVYDYTIESGVFYKYGIQVIDTHGERGIMNPQGRAIIRELEYSYLLGDKGRELKLNLTPLVSSYMYNYSESKVDTIGGEFPYITRNGITKYRSFPISGMISFNMDDQETFTNDNELYYYKDIISQYKDYRKIHHDFKTYDYKREYDFREKVLEFLYDGKPKLFRSATEGNIIIRLMGVSCVPNATLNRMIYTFNATAYEIAENTFENYSKYGLIDVGQWESDLSVYETKIGQLDLDFNIGDNIIAKIFEYYDRSGRNLAGSRISIKNIHHLSLEYCSKPLRVYNNANEIVLGNNVLYGGEKITIYGGRTRYYYFDENIIFNKSSSLICLGGLDEIYDEDGEQITNKIHITVDFLYEEEKTKYEAKKINWQKSKKGIGQLYHHFEPGSNLYNEIYYKYYYEWRNSFRRLNRLTWTTLEAPVGSVFQFLDSTDNKTQNVETMLHEVNDTGILHFYGISDIIGIKYIGRRNPETGEIIKNLPCDVIIDYLYYIIEGQYREDE